MLSGFGILNDFYFLIENQLVSRLFADILFSSLFALNYLQTSIFSSLFALKDR